MSCRNALTYVLFSEGIPYIYYGTEQGYTVDREPLWHSSYSKQHPLWLFLRISVAYRKEAKVCVCERWFAVCAGPLNDSSSSLAATEGGCMLAGTC